MTSDTGRGLERRYRRLLAAYPAEYRETYQEEMLGVLLDGAEPGRTRPTLTEAVDLLSGATRYRLRRARGDLRGRPWRDTAALVSVVAPATMLLIQVYALLGAPVVEMYLVHAQVRVTALFEPAPRLGPSVWVPPAAWALVTVAALVGPRFAAIGLAWAAVATDCGVTGLRYLRFGPWERPSMWLLALGVVAALALTMGSGRRTGLRLLGRWRLAVLAAIGAFLVAGDITYLNAAWRLPYWSGFLFWGTGARVAAVLAGLVLLYRLDRPVRRRLMAVLVSLAVLVLVEGAIDLAFFAVPVRPPAMLVPAEPVALAVVAIAAFAVATGLVRRGERVRTGSTLARWP